MEGLEMGGRGGWGLTGGQAAGAQPPRPVRRRQRWGLTGLVTLLTLAAGGMFWCRNSSAVLSAPISAAGSALAPSGWGLLQSITPQYPPPQAL